MPIEFSRNVNTWNTGHISVLKYRHLSLNLVYLLYSRSIYNVVIPKLDKWLAKFFTLVKDEHDMCHQPPTFLRVYNEELFVSTPRVIEIDVLLRR